MSKWNEDCFGQYGECLTKSPTNNTIPNYLQSQSTNDRLSCNRFLSIGPVRYGMRIGAVSPPPPGTAGLRYRSKYYYCWSTASSSSSSLLLSSTSEAASGSSSSSSSLYKINNNGDGDSDLEVSQLSSQPSSTPINRFGIISCTNIMGIDDQLSCGDDNNNSTEKILPPAKSPPFRDQSHFRQQFNSALVRPQLEYYQPDNCDHVINPCHSQTDHKITDDSPHPFYKVQYWANLDRPARFRFGGNRSPSSLQKKALNSCSKQHKVPDESSVKQPPIPPPRTKSKDHQSVRSSQNNTILSLYKPSNRFSCISRLSNSSSNNESCDSPISTRSASFSQVDYCIDKNKYVRSSRANEQDTSTTYQSLPRKCKTNQLDDSSNNDNKKQPPLIYHQSPSYSLNNTRELTETCCSNKEMNNLDKKRDIISKRRKGVYLSQWPNMSACKIDDNDITINISTYDDESTEKLSNHSNDLNKDNTEYLSDQTNSTSSKKDYTENNLNRRYSKRPIRGPYGQMLEAEMKEKQLYDNKQHFSNENVNNDLKDRIIPQIKLKSDISVENELNQKVNNALVLNINDYETTNDLNYTKSDGSGTKSASPEISNEFFEQLRDSSEQISSPETSINVQHYNDTRSHVVVELFENEVIYVESLEIIVTKYLDPLKSSENAHLLDISAIEEIFYHIPFLLKHHQVFLEELKKRLEQWDLKQKIGDLFLDMFSKPQVIDTYTNYVNNFKRARELLKNAQQSKPAFTKFLENTSREHKGKLSLDSLLIKPIQKFPKYELLLQRLIKHTDINHPDYNFVLAAQRQVHDQLLKINCTEKEALELEQLREIESLIEGAVDLTSSPDRQYLRHDLVMMTAVDGGTRKERALFLFSDILLITSIKRRSGTIKRPLTAGSQGNVTSTLEANKYKLLMKIHLDDLEIVRNKDDHFKHQMIEIDNLTEDLTLLNQIHDLSWSLHCNHTQLDELLKEMMTSVNKQLTEQQSGDTQMARLDLTLNTSNGLENISIVFSNTEKRTSWEESFNEAKQKLVKNNDRKQCPELIETVPIRKTRAGLQFTCAAPTIGDNGKDVWVCNSDGYVGQVCVLSLQPEPSVISCNGVCNARILCIASVPGVVMNDSNEKCSDKGGDNLEQLPDQNVVNRIDFDSSSNSSRSSRNSNESRSSSDEDEKSESDIGLNNGSSGGGGGGGASVINNEQTKTKMDLSDNFSGSSSSNDLLDAHDNKPTMWLGTEDGFIHVYNSCNNIRIKKNKIKIQHGSPVLSIVYLDNKVFVSLANGEIIMYNRDNNSGGWNTNSPTTLLVGTSTIPASKMLSHFGKLWCACGSTIKIYNVDSLSVENSFTVHNDNNKSIACIVVSGNAVWLSLQNSSIIKCFHVQTFELLCEINVAPAVTKMLTSCDDIIRQHKAACLRVTALVACKELLWIGTSAGVLLTMPLPHISSSNNKLTNLSMVHGVSHGHTGHVRFLTSVELPAALDNIEHDKNVFKGKADQKKANRTLVISGGDGYEDFRSSNLSEVAGREDSTNHLLLWNV